MSRITVLIPEQTIKDLVKAATYAPSGKNQQNWHVVVVTDKNKIAEIARIVEEKNAELATYLRDEKKIKGFKGTVRVDLLISLLSFFDLNKPGYRSL